MEKSPYRTEKNLLTVREKSAYRAEKDLLTAREKTPYRVAVKSAYRAQTDRIWTGNACCAGISEGEGRVDAVLKLKQLGGKGGRADRESRADKGGVSFCMRCCKEKN